MNKRKSNRLRRLILFVSNPDNENTDPGVTDLITDRVFP